MSMGCSFRWNPRRIIGDAEQWLIAHEVVTNYGGALKTDKGVNTVISNVQALSNEAQSHLADLDTVDRESQLAIQDLEDLSSTKKNDSSFLVTPIRSSLKRRMCACKCWGSSGNTAKHSVNAT